MFFNDIEGHEGPLQILKRAIAHGTLAHAYLFSGEYGIGKKMTALGLAAAVNCAAASPDGGCGSCPSCRKVASGGHPDVHLLAAEGNEIKIDQVREAQADLALRPFEGNKKVLIVDGAEGLNAASANAFLKTLEEPPGDALIILITAMPQGLLPTIRSRCQEIVFHQLPPYPCGGTVQAEASRMISGSLRRLRRSLGRGIEMDIDAEKALRDEVLALWSGLGRFSPGETLHQAEAYGRTASGWNACSTSGSSIRDCVVYRETSEEHLLVNGEADGPAPAVVRTPAPSGDVS
jgi:DNA polymerase-3 subunit delta'